MVAVCALAYWLGSVSGRPTLPNGGLVIAAQYLDFGTVWEDSRMSLKIPIKNTSALPVEVLDLVTSCACTSLKPRGLKIGPGETQEIDLELNLSQRAVDQDWNQNQLAVKIAPTIKGAQVRQIGWSITGQVKKLLSVLPPNLVLRDDIVRGRISTPTTARVISTLPLDELVVRCDATNANVEVTGGPQDFQIEITPQSDLPFGFFGFDMQLQPKRSAETLPGKSIRVEGFMHQKVEAVPSKIALGALPVGAVTAQTLVLVSRNDKRFQVQSWEASGGDVIIEQISAKESEGNSVAFKITESIRNLGKQESTVSFVVRTEDGERLHVYCQSSHYGLAGKR
jgi:Protein of unknown function (DUF1573)